MDRNSVGDIANKVRTQLTKLPLSAAKQDLISRNQVYAHFGEGVGSDRVSGDNRGPPILGLPEVVAWAGKVNGEQVVEEERTVFGKVGLGSAEAEQEKEYESLHDC